MKKLKGYSFKANNQEIVFKDMFTNHQPSFDCIFFSTNIEGQLCKVFELENQVSDLKFQKEKLMLEQLKGEWFVTYSNSHEFVYKKNRYGVIVFENVRKGSLIGDKVAVIEEKQLLGIVKNILRVLKEFHSKNLTLLAIKPDSLTSSIDKSFAIPIQYSLILNKPYDQNTLNNSQIHRHFLQENFKYKSPQILNSFSKDIIDWRSDIFAFGCLLYQLIYKTYPFQSSLAVLNLSYNNHMDDSKFIQKPINLIIQQCLVQYSKRPSASSLLSLFPQDRQNVLCENKQNKKSIFDQLKNAITIMTTQSQKWIVKYIQPTGKAPDEYLAHRLLNKIYKNNLKLQKIYSLIQKHAVQNQKSVESISKIMCLLWVFIRKGPAAIIDDYPNNIQSILKVCQKLKTDNIIQQLNIVISLKVIIVEQFKHVLEGNFGLYKLQGIKQINSNILISLVDYLKNVVDAYRRLVHPPSYICIFFFDQIYDLCCSLILLYLSISNDIDKARRNKDQALKSVEKQLEKTLKVIAGLPRAELHLIASLDSLQNYKHFFEFQAVDSVKISAFQLFYKTNLVYHNLKLPISFKSMSKQQETLYDDQDDDDYQMKQEKFIDGLIGGNKPNKVLNNEKQKQIKTGSTQAEKDGKSKFSDFDVLWGQIKKPKQSNNQIQNGFQNVFGGNKLAKSSFLQLQFPQKTNKPISKNAFPNFQIQQRPRQKSMIDFNQTLTTKPINKPLASSQVDIFDFNFPTKKVEEKPAKQAVNFQFLNNNKQVASSSVAPSFDIFQQPQPKPQKIPETNTLVQQFVNSLRDQQLKSLVRSNNIVINFSTMNLNKVIGCGNAGQVYQGSFDSKIVAIKKIKSKQQNPNAHKQFEREITTLIIIGKHLRLNSLIGLSKHDNDYYLLMDFCAGGNLFELLHRRMDLNIPWKVRIIIARQIAEGMQYLHSHCKIIHRDLKSLNVLIANKYSTGQKIQDNIIVKITDFGLARNPDQFMTNALGTLHWMAPQLLQGKQYDSKVDVYSFGIVLWQLCCRQTPYHQFKSPHMIIKHVAINGGRPDLKSLNQGCPQQLKQLMTKCWSTNPSFRPVFQTIVQILKKMQC